MDNTLLEQIKNLISSRTGLRISDNNASFKLLINRRIKALKLNTAFDYYALLQQPGMARLEEEYKHFICNITTGETFFFRDQNQFELLRLQILPELINRNRIKRRLKIWSAGCATGEEAYSLAMLLEELDEKLSGWEILILGTDINPDALAKARMGHYSEWSFRQVSEQRKQRFFQPTDSGWTLNRDICQRVKFRQMNLVTESYPTAHDDLKQMDLILCRNVFIYFESAMVTQIANKMTASLAEGGFLITGHGELYAHKLGELRTRIFLHSIVYQKPSHLQLPISVQTVPPIAKPVLAIPTKARIEKTAIITPKVTPSPTLPFEAPITMKDAWTYANQGYPEKARAYCNQLMTQTPFDHHPYYLVALLVQEQGDMEQAKTFLKKVMYLAPNFIAAYIELADIYVKEKNLPMAKTLWSAASKLLKQLPKDMCVEMFGNATATDIMQFVKNKQSQAILPS